MTLDAAAEIVWQRLRARVAVAPRMAAQESITEGLQAALDAGFIALSEPPIFSLLWTRIDPQGPGLHLPARPGDTGYDLEAAEELLLAPSQQVDMETNVRVKLPPDCWGEIRARSSVALRNLVVAATVIDNGFTGHLRVLLRNANRFPNSHTDWLGRVKIERGQRIAQLVLHQGVTVGCTEVPELKHDPRRGPLGFGSTDTALEEA